MSEASRSGGERRLDPAALVIALVLIGLGALIAYDAASLSLSPVYSRVGPKAFPYGVAVGLALLGLATAASAFRGEAVEREPLDFPPVIWIIGGLVAQILLLGVAGFSIATGVLFAATARGLGRGPLWLTIPIGIVLCFLIYLIFSKGLQLSLPQGPLERLV